MALEIRRIVTGHDASGKAVVASDERLAGADRAGRPRSARVEIWSTDHMPVDNSAAAAAAQQRGFVTRYFVLIDAAPATVGGEALRTHYPAP